MAHRAGHTGPQEQIRTAPTFLDQIVEAFSQAPERFRRLQSGPGTFKAEKPRTVAGIPQASGPGAEAQLLNTLLNADKAFIGDTASDIFGAIANVPSLIDPRVGKDPILERLARQLGSFIGIEDFTGVGAAAGGIRRLFREGAKRASRVKPKGLKSSSRKAQRAQPASSLWASRT